MAEVAVEGQELETSGGWHQGERATGGEDWSGGGWKKERHVYDGKRMRKPVVRKTVDFNSTVLLHIEVNSMSNIIFLYYTGCLNIK